MIDETRSLGAFSAVSPRYATSFGGRPSPRVQPARRIGTDVSSRPESQRTDDLRPSRQLQFWEGLLDQPGGRFITLGQANDR